MVDNSRRPKVGLLGLTLEFYEQLAPSLRPDRERFVRERLIPNLSRNADVRFGGAVFTRERVDQAIAEYERDGADAILVVLLSYSPSLIAAPALQRTRLPIIVWNTQELLSVDTSYGDAELVANHGVHGTHDLCNVLVRAGVPFQYVTGHVDDRKAIAALADRFRAAYAVGRLRRARLGLLGYPFPGMGDFGLDTTQMATSLGCAWEALSVSEYNRRAQNADAAEVRKLVSDYRNAYEIGPNIADEDLAGTARAEIAMRGIVRDYRLDAYTYQFLSFGQDDRTETLPFVAASRLLADGIGFGGEGDLIAAAHSALAGWLHPPASFSEMFTIDFGGNAVLLSHMGEANVAMARKDKRVRMVRRPGPIVPTRASQLALATAFEPGPATLTALTLTAGSRWRIIASPVTIEDFGPLPQLAVPHSKIRPAGNVSEFLTAYANAGGPHHLAICFGDARAKLALAAGYLGADYVEV
jgi:L-arabinose isomerase